MGVGKVSILVVMESAQEGAEDAAGNLSPVRFQSLL